MRETSVESPIELKDGLSNTLKYVIKDQFSHNDVIVEL
jgi:hypothetical protein